MTKIKYLKILTSIFIILLFIFLCSPCTYATYIEDLNNFSTFLSALENNSTFISQKDNYSNILIGFVGVNNNTGNYMYWVIMSNDSTINFTYSSESQKYCLLNIGTQPHQEYATSSFISFSSSNTSNMYCYLRDGYSGYSNMLDRFNDNVYYYKLSSPITFNGNEVITPPSNYDFSFVLNDESTNTEHNFDFMFQEGSFNDGRTFTSDDLASGHYIVNIKSLVHNKYELSNSSVDTWYVNGFIDYVDFNDTEGSKTQFYWSSGYEMPKVLNQTSDDLQVYRFMFNGYSSDSFNYADLSEDSNLVTIMPKQFTSYSKYTYPNGCTFGYSNRDIYFGIDTSLYGFNGLTSHKFYDESLYSILSVDSIKENNIPSSDEYVASQVRSFIENNNADSYPSSNLSIGQDFIKNYNGTHIDDIKPYSAIVDLSGTSNDEATDDLTENWGILDYLKAIPKILGNLPNAFRDLFNWLFTPNTAELVSMIEELDDYFEVHFGSFYEGFHFIYGVLDTIKEKYTSTYSNYPFTIPRNSLVQSGKR